MRRLSLILILLVISTAPTTGFSQRNKAKPDGTLRYWFRQDPPSLDPAHATDTTSAIVVSHIFDGLVDLDPKTVEPVPAVAEKWEISGDGLVYTFHLRKGVKFHNGREVKAEDFRYSFERTLDPKTKSERTWVLDQIKGSDARMKGEADMVEGIKVIDDYTLQLTLKEPLAFFLPLLSMEAASVVPKEEVKKLGEDFGLHPVGCGPFVFDSWIRDSKLILKGFSEYYGTGPYLAEIRFLIHRELSQALELYKAGEIDILTDIPPLKVQRTKKELPDDFLMWDILGTYYLCFNLEKAPFKNNKALRQAFNHAIDKRAICEKLLEDVPYPAKGILPKGTAAYNPDLKGYDYDIEKANALLAKAGYPDGKGLDPIDLWYNTSELHKSLCLLVQDNLRQIGVTVNLKSMDWAPYLDATKNGETEFCREGWLADNKDPDNFLFVLLDSKNIGEGNYARYKNPEFDALVEKARKMTNMEERIPLYQQAEKMAVEDAVWIFLYHYRDVLLRKPYIKGVVQPLQGDFKIPLEKIQIVK
jgi:oligopeptide transport system substrate-binding protein